MCGAFGVDVSSAVILRSVVLLWLLATSVAALSLWVAGDLSGWMVMVANATLFTAIALS